MTQFFEQITFQPFPKIARLSRNMIITEKLDGTNAQVIISEDGQQIGAASRTRLITPESDNFGFAAWVRDNKDELLKLGPGRHFGEWWGSGIQRGYGLPKGEKRFSLFNVGRWTDSRRPNPPIWAFNGSPVSWVPSLDAHECPECCSVVPAIGFGPFNTDDIETTLDRLRENGSAAAPGFMQPEGIVIFHVQGGYLFKKTFEKDAAGKERGA